LTTEHILQKDKEMSHMNQLVRRVKSLPLKLSQNSHLIINSKVPVNVLLLPQWRDDGHIALEETSQKSLMSKFDWSIETRDGKKIGLSTIDVNIGLVNNLEDSFLTHTEQKVHEEDVCADTGPGLTLIAEIPEKCNIRCTLHRGGDITVNKKLEGEDGFVFMTSGGNILLDKLRGDKITLDSSFKGNTSGTIFVKKACESQELAISIGKGGRLRAKMLNVSNANIEVEDGGMSDIEKLDEDDSGALIDISSIYASESGEGVHLAVKKSADALSNDGTIMTKKVRVKSNHGHLSVRAISDFNVFESSSLDKNGQEMCHVDLGGVSGSIDVSIERIEGGDKFHNSCDPIPSLAAKVHIDSLSPGQANILTSDFGDLNVTLDRKIESDIRLLSTPLLNDTDPNLMLEDDDNELVQSLCKHDDDLDKLLPSVVKDEMNGNEFDRSYRIEIETDAFKGHRAVDMKYVEYVQGVIENKSLEPNSRFDVKTKGLSSGKIRIEGAAGQALLGFSGGKKNEDGEDFSNDHLVDLPLLAVATTGKIKVESLSWFGAIARRYGIENEDRDLGRQAKAGTVADARKQ